MKISPYFLQGYLFGTLFVAAIELFFMFWQAVAIAVVASLVILLIILQFKDNNQSKLN